MNILEKAKKNILAGNFLTQDELTQAQYELITDPKTEWEAISKLHDELFGSHYANIKAEFIATGPYFPDASDLPPETYADSEVEEEAPALV